MSITSFTGDHRFLSNFWMAPIEYDGVTWPSVEHAYQALKFTDKEKREKIRNLKTAEEAKKQGATKKFYRADWDDVKLDIMNELVMAKFQQHHMLAERLMATADKE